MIWIVNNCALLILGTIAGVMGVSFYLRNSSSAGNIRHYMLLMKFLVMKLNVVIMI